MVNTWTPARGDIVWIDMNPQAGHEQAGRRPAVVLSPAEYNSRTGLAVMCPITCQIKGYPFEVPIPDGLPITGTVLSDQVRSLDWRRSNAAPIAALPAPSLAAILARLTALLQP